MDKIEIKAVIEQAFTTSEADEYVVLFSEMTDIPAKFEYVRDLFEIRIMAANEPVNPGNAGDAIKNSYEAMLNAIVNKKWR